MRRVCAAYSFRRFLRDDLAGVAVEHESTPRLQCDKHAAILYLGQPSVIRMRIENRNAIDTNDGVKTIIPAGRGPANLMVTSGYPEVSASRLEVPELDVREAVLAQPAVYVVSQRRSGEDRNHFDSQMQQGGENSREAIPVHPSLWIVQNRLFCLDHFASSGYSSCNIRRTHGPAPRLRYSSASAGVSASENRTLTA
jgi:hypothetical protein